MTGFLRHPINGTGAGTYATLWTRYGRSTARILNAHSLYLEELAELGIVGGGVVIAVVVSILVALARRARGPGRSVWAALFAGALMWAVHAGVDWDWQMPAATAWVFAAGGLALAAPVERPKRTARLWARFADRARMPGSRHHAGDGLAIPDPDREGCPRLRARQLYKRRTSGPCVERGIDLALGSVRGDELLREPGRDSIRSRCAP